MTLGQLRARFRARVPSAKSAGITNTTMNNLLNEGVDEVNLIAKVYNKSNGSEFESTINKQTYSISKDAVISDYLAIGKSGIWFEKSDGTFERLIPKTRVWFDDNIRNWREASAGDPQFYYVEGDEIGFDVPFSASRTLRVFHLLKSIAMDSDDNYPWVNTTTEVTALMAMDNAIVAYARWQVQPALGKDKNGVLTEQQFQKEALASGRKVKARDDYSNYFSNGMSFRA